MRNQALFIFVFICHISFYAQTQSPWQKVTNESTTSKKLSSITIKEPTLYRLDLNSFKQSLTSITNKTAKKTAVEISIPNKNGDLEKFTVSEYSNFEPELQDKFPDIRAYEGKGITDNKARLNFSLSPKGIQTIILRADNATEFIETYSEDPSLYVVISSKTRNKGELPLSCKTEDVALNKDLLSKTAKISSNNKVFKTLRLALSCTGEYARYFGGPTATTADALAGMNATMTRVNAIFNRDLAVKLNIIANNNLIIYTNPATDPYSNASSLDNWALELQNTLTTVITNSGYDIGHLFGASGGGGNAGCIGCVCINPSVSDPYGKGSAYTSPSNGKPEGEAFDIDFVAHEMGHQLGANHSFSYEIEGTGVSVEPGSGSTIMGYAGVTEQYDIQAYSDSYFAYANILQIQNNLATKSCPTSTTITNNPPQINAGADYTIPKGTAFILKGTGSDSDGDTITYCWEQNDSATSANKDNSYAVSTKTNGPLFRSIAPANSPTRYMPPYSNVLANKLTSSWESVSNVARTLHFVLTGRDNAAMGTAQTNSDEMIVTVSGNIGPFAITSQNSEDIEWPQGSNQTITWSVNNSNTLAGAANINIKLSYDGGLTFPTILASNTPNDGSEIVTVPNVTEKNCRILIEPVNNIFYAVNSKSFAIGYTVSNTCNSYTYAAPFAIPEKSAYTTRTINYPTTTGEVSDINFKVDLTHAFISDIQMEVVSPQGTTVKLLERSCNDTNGTLSLTFDDSGTELKCGVSTAQTVTPFENLSAFNGENPSGTWTFRIRDAFTDDTGTLNSASITICEKSFILKQPEFRILDFMAFSNPNNGTFKVKFTSDSSSTVQIKIHDILGKLLFQNEYPKTNLFEEFIQIPNAQSGLYFLETAVAEKKIITKILVE
ncbi:zinc-dependent metalloprotease family protein [Flavobacterium sp. NG2]|uniref:reprolysin-like metallopeptidase n=1 Tax=Flavobacterium sp. NG2 TaxID=3097547 RepID=UPI002A82F252|nr:zinc-dependent metalloprotease family protein [Flavobacterium sp. NG2]WPR72104.1 zinc-dependent metalloprotease family protein [Flavobacterium sp. NG2]